MTAANIELDQLARRRAKAKLGWLRHTAIYILVNLGLIAHALLTGRHWMPAPLLGWGLGLALHGLAVWTLAPRSAMLDRMIERERARLQNRT